jgi:hypothetical protein
MSIPRSIALVLAGALAGVSLVVACTGESGDPFGAGTPGKADELSLDGGVPAASPCGRWDVKIRAVFSSSNAAASMDTGWEPIGVAGPADVSGATYGVLLRRCAD